MRIVRLLSAGLTGVWLLMVLSGILFITSYEIGQREFQVTVVKSVIGMLMIVFALVEFLPRFEKMEFDQKWLPLGGVVSGFFGGLSGHQGALRSAFLSKAWLDRDAFIATGESIAVLVDITRITIYAGHISVIGAEADWNLILAATLAALSGALVGSRLLQKITMKTVQIIVGIMLVFIGVLLAGGLI